MGTVPQEKREEFVATTTEEKATEEKQGKPKIWDALEQDVFEGQEQDWKALDKHITDVIDKINSYQNENEGINIAQIIKFLIASDVSREHLCLAIGMAEVTFHQNPMLQMMGANSPLRDIWQVANEESAHKWIVEDPDEEGDASEEEN